MSVPVERPVEGAVDAPPLFLPDESFPPYRFVPGHTPHPFKQEGGYLFGQKHDPPPYFAAAEWRSNRAYLRGLDFFNRGWWWEAHEEWEAFWKVCRDRDDAQHGLLQALIQFAAASLNVERGHVSAAGRLLSSSLEHLQRAGRAGPRLCGLDLDDIGAAARRHLADAQQGAVQGFYLRPD